jgi:anti-sigma B factor antagonist
MAEDVPLTLRTDITLESTVVHCGGRLISGTADRLKSYVKPLIVREGNVVLDLTDVTFMDSMGLGTIVTLWVSSKNAGCQFVLINLSPRIRDLFTVTHLLSLFESCGEANVRIP